VTERDVKADAPSGSRPVRYPGPMPAPPRSPPPIPRIARRAWPWIVALAVVASPALGRAPAAELTVTAFGRQQFDLASGRTVLLDGGALVDRRSGVRMEAAWVSYAEGVDILARDARLAGDLGQVEATEVAIDLVGGRLWAAGGVVWTREGFEVRGDALRFDVEAGIAGLVGDVVATSPQAAAAEAWVEIAGGRVLLLGPYRFVDGPFVLRGEAGSALQLDLVETPTGPGYDARTDVEPGWREAVERARRDGWSGSAE
jgi:hypothetical protein